MIGWKEYSFGDLVDFPPKIQLKKGEEYPFIDMDTVKPENRYVTNLQSKKYDSSGSAKFADKDVLLARITPCLQNGKIAQVKISESTKGFGSTEFFVFRAKVDLLDQNFLFYLSKSDLIWKNAVNSMVGASGRQRADASYLKRVKFNIPDINEQRKIAAILTAYDDLIENNLQRIALLEKMAEEIYLEWFVRLRFPNYENERFEKGLPATWDIKPVKDIVDRKKFGRLYYEHELSEDGSVIVIDQSRNDYLGFYDGEPQHMATSSDPIILFGDHSCKMVLITKPFSLAENVIPFKPKQKISTYFLYHLVKDLTRTIEYKRHWTDLTIKKVLVPSETLQIEFERLVKSSHEQIELLRNSISKIQKTRDSLLPRLIAGKLSVENLDIKFPPSMEEELQ